MTLVKSLHRLNLQQYQFTLFLFLVSVKTGKIFNILDRIITVFGKMYSIALDLVLMGTDSDRKALVGCRSGSVSAEMMLTRPDPDPHY
jgi:hypothetical protein